MSLPVVVNEELAVEYPCQVAALLDRVLGKVCARGVFCPVLSAVVLVPERGNIWENSRFFQDDFVSENGGVFAANVRRIVFALSGACAARGVTLCDVSARCIAVPDGADTIPPRLVFSAGGLAKTAEAQAKECSPAAGMAEAEAKTGDLSAGKTVSGRISIDGNTRSSFSIVMAGFAGLEATRVIISARLEQLKGRLSGQYLEDGFLAAGQTDVRPAVRLALGHGALVKPAGEGGVFAALWELGELLHCGMRVELRDILLRQETIEVCEVLDINPYMMFSGGCLLAVTDCPDELLAAYGRENIPAAYIGRLSENNGRILQNGGEQRFLEPFREDELYRCRILRG